MQFLTAQQLADVLIRLGSPFDAHAAEKRALGMFPREVAQEIARHTNSPGMSALQKFSMSFAQELDERFGAPSARPQIEKSVNGVPNPIGKVRSENLAGDPTDNQEWVKLVVSVTP